MLGAEGMRRIGAENLDLVGDEGEFFQRLLQGLLFGMAFGVGIKLRGGETAERFPRRGLTHEMQSGNLWRIFTESNLLDPFP